MTANASTAGAAPLTPSWHLYLGDCIEGMRELPDKSVDHFVTDPAYCEHVHRNFGRESRNDGSKSRDEIAFKALSVDEAFEAAEQMVRLARRWIILFCDEFSLEVWRKAITAAGGEYVRFGLWLKTDAMPQLSGDGPGTPAEHLCIAHSADRVGRKRWNAGGKVARWVGPHREPHVARFHQTQKPEWLLQELLADFTDDGDLIADPYAGSATAAVAAWRMGRGYVGWEKDAATHARASARVQESRRQPPLFPRAAKPKQQGLGFTSGEAPQALK